MITGIWRVLSCRLEHTHDFQAIHARHHHIKKDQVRDAFTRHLECLLAIFRQDDLVLVLQQLGQQHPIVFLVINN
jgi:hypothetical protein